MTKWNPCPTTDTQFWRKAQLKKKKKWLHSLLLKKKKNQTVLEFENITVTSFQVTSPIYCYCCKTWIWDHIYTFRILLSKQQTSKFGKPSNYCQLDGLKEHTEREHLKNHLVPFQPWIFNVHTHTQTAARTATDTTFITERIHTISQMMPF